MTPTQKTAATRIMQRNLAEHPDWIVLNNTMEALFQWSETDDELRTWLLPHLQRLTGDSRNSVSKRATKLVARHKARSG